MEDNPTEYYEKQFLLSALFCVGPGSFKVWCSHRDFQKQKHSENRTPEKGFRAQSFYLRQRQIFEKTCRCFSSACLAVPKERLMHSLLLRARQNKTFLLETGPGISFRPIFVFDEDVQNLRKVCASRSSGLHFSRCGSCCPAMVCSRNSYNSGLQHCEVTKCDCPAQPRDSYSFTL